MARGRLQVWVESCIRAGHISFADWIEAETDDAAISETGDIRDRREHLRGLAKGNGLSRGSIRLARFNGLRLSCLFSVDLLRLGFQLSGHFLENDPVGLMARALCDVEAVPCPIMKAFCVIPHRSQTNGPRLTFRLQLRLLTAGKGRERTLAIA